MEQDRNNPAAAEIEMLELLAEKKARDRLYDHGPTFDKGLLQSEIDLTPSSFGVAARRRAMMSLVSKGEAVREPGGSRGKPFRITAKGEERLAEYLRRAGGRTNPVEGPHHRPADDDAPMTWLGRIYAEAMFPDEGNKGRRGK